MSQIEAKIGQPVIWKAEVYVLGADDGGIETRVAWTRRRVEGQEAYTTSRLGIDNQRVNTEDIRTRPLQNDASGYCAWSYTYAT